MVVVAQLVRALVCGTKGRRFEPGLPPKKQKPFKKLKGFFWFQKLVVYANIGIKSKILELIYIWLIKNNYIQKSLHL